MILAFLAVIIEADCKGKITVKMTLITTQAERNKVIYMFDKQVATPVANNAKKISFYPESYNEYIDAKNMQKVSATVKITTYSDDTILPKRATNGSVGYDLHSPDNVHIDAQKTIKIPIGISLECPAGMYPRIGDRSNMATKGILVRGGVIDNDYRGNIIMCLHNLSGEPILIEKGQRIAQLIFEKNGTPCLERVRILEETERGQKGVWKYKQETICNIPNQQKSCSNHFENRK